MIKIGNSQGMRFPKSVIEQCGFENELELSVEGGGLMVRAKRSRRAGWADDAAICAAAGDDELLLPDTMANEFDEKEWTW
jgi:antitoxin MazE